MHCTTMIAVLMLMCVAVRALPVSESEINQWNLFKVEYNKQYEDAEEEFRMKIFLNASNFIKEHNKRFEQGLETFTLGINKFADMTDQEFKNMMGYDPSEMDTEDASEYIPDLSKPIPNGWNWSKKGAVTPAKDQTTKCGSCWAFSATGALEGQHYIKKGKLVSLSEQNLLDCSSQYGNRGCDGGNPVKAYRYVIKNGGIDTEVSYPYDAEVETCRYTPKNSGANATSFEKVQNNENFLKTAVATKGPISCAVNADTREFQYYKRGVLNVDGCSKNVNHAVLIVGYGENKKLGQYWIVKNSWGTSWGNNGFIKIARNKDNMCGIGLGASYPIV